MKKRTNPTCARCGKSLGSRDYIMFDFQDYSGKPSIGWHSGAICQADSILTRLISVEKVSNFDTLTIESILSEISKRGENRVLWRSENVL